MTETQEERWIRLYAMGASISRMAEGSGVSGEEVADVVLEPGWRDRVPDLKPESARKTGIAVLVDDVEYPSMGEATRKLGFAKDSLRTCLRLGYIKMKGHSIAYADPVREAARFAREAKQEVQVSGGDAEMIPSSHPEFEERRKTVALPLPSENDGSKSRYASTQSLGAMGWKSGN